MGACVFAAGGEKAVRCEVTDLIDVFCEMCVVNRWKAVVLFRSMDRAV